LEEGLMEVVNRRCVKKTSGSGWVSGQLLAGK